MVFLHRLLAFVHGLLQRLLPDIGTLQGCAEALAVRLVLKALGRNTIVAMATGCSTNAIIHLVAMANRAGIDLGLDDFDRIAAALGLPGDT